MHLRDFLADPELIEAGFLEAVVWEPDHSRSRLLELEARYGLDTVEVYEEYRRAGQLFPGATAGGFWPLSRRRTWRSGSTTTRSSGPAAETRENSAVLPGPDARTVEAAGDRPRTRPQGENGEIVTVAAVEGENRLHPVSPVVGWHSYGAA
ncbi:MAG: hypothetical protein ACPLRW_06740 [Moorellales bacterium]